MKVPLLAGGPRTKVSKEEAEEIVARWKQDIEAADGVVKVDISCRAWSQQAFDVIKPFLKEVAKTVEYVNFADVIASLDTDEGLSVTKDLSATFEEADLRCIELSDNAMGPRGLGRVESMFLNSHLQSLYLGNCGLSAESMIFLKDYVLADDKRIARVLTDLVLDRNMMGPAGAKVVGEILPHCKKLQYFSYLGSRPGPQGALSLARGLEDLSKEVESPELVKLEIDDATFGGDDDDDDDEAAAYVHLANALKRTQKLRHLNLTDGALGIAGLKKVLGSISESGAKLTHLILGK